MLIYGKGDTNFVLSAPHAGSLKPKDFPTRSYGKKLKDTHSDRIAKTIIRICNECPYYVVADIHRSRVDLNRDLKEAAQGNYRAIQVWNQWHFILNYYLENATRKGKALYVDLHSHNESDEFQIGYDLNSKQYQEVKSNPLHPLYEKMFGEFSLKSLLEDRGYKVFSPNSKDVYFNGGYNIETYKKKSNVMAVQIEVPVSVAKEKEIASDLYHILITYKEKFVD